MGDVSMGFLTALRVFCFLHRSTGSSRWAQPSRRFRPWLELLDGRLLPSTFTVTDLGDAGVGSELEGDLRYCINTANANTDLSNHIQFQPDLAGTIILSRGALAITKNLEIDGPGQEVLTVSGNLQSGVFNITNNPRVQDVRLSGLTIADGTGIPFGGQRRGGGIYNDHAALSLTRVTISGNVLPGQGYGAGIDNESGALTLQSSTVTANQVGLPGYGSAIYNGVGTVTIRDSSINANIGTSIFIPSTIYDGNDTDVVTISGSTILNNVGDGIERGNVTIDHSTIAGNGNFGVAVNRATVDHSTISGNRYTGIDTGLYLMLTDSTVADNTEGGVRGGGFASVNGSTISGNSSTSNGGGFANGGTGSFAEIMNSTISGNTAEEGGGVEVGSRDSTIELVSCTVVGNSATGTTLFSEGGGGIGSYAGGGGQGTLLLLNTIVAGNSSATTGPDVDATATSLGYNFIGEADDSSGWGNHDLTGTSDNPLDPMLGPLQDNGGPTFTHAPLAGSPIIFVGDPGFYRSPDQRGSWRAEAIGAVEATQATSFRVLAPSIVAPGQPFAITVIAVDAWGNTASTYHGTVHFSSTDLGAQLPDDYVFAATDGGAQTFVASLATPGLQTISIRDVDNAALSVDLSVLVDDGLDPLRPNKFTRSPAQMPG
jgi:hypothetical protein